MKTPEGLAVPGPSCFVFLQAGTQWPEGCAPRPVPKTSFTAALNLSSLNILLFPTSETAGKINTLMTKRFLQLEPGEALKIEATSEGRFPTGRALSHSAPTRATSRNKAVFSECLGKGRCLYSSLGGKPDCSGILAALCWECPTPHTTRKTKEQHLGTMCDTI